MAKTVFYSFHYSRDVHRVQLIKNINALRGQPILNSQQWESLRQRGTSAIQQWIDAELAHKRAVVVLIGQETAKRPWVQYEIEKAWSMRKPLLGIRIHGISSMGSTDAAGKNPFRVAGLSGVPIHDPTTRDWLGRIDTQATYRTLAASIERWAAAGARRP